MENNLFKTVLIPNWDNVPVGTKFKGKIEEIECDGRIQKENEVIYLCQNVKNGANCSDKLGFHYSWNIGKGNSVNLVENDIEIISLELDPSFVAPPIVKVGDYQVTFKKGEIEVGCQTIPNEQVMEVIKHLIW